MGRFHNEMEKKSGITERTAKDWGEAPVAIIPESRSIAFRLQKHCFQTLIALLSDADCIAPRQQKHCSQTAKALLPASKSNEVAF